MNFKAQSKCFDIFYQTRGKIGFVHLCTAKEEVYASLRFSGAATLLYKRSCYKCNTKTALELSGAVFNNMALIDLLALLYEAKLPNLLKFLLV
jgi:hypothetical protein